MLLPLLLMLLQPLLHPFMQGAREGRMYHPSSSNLRMLLETRAG